MSNKYNNPFMDMDFSKFMDMSKIMDPSKMMDMSKFMNGAKMPSLDVEAMMASQRKNIEAVAAANQKAFETIQNYMTRQSELARQSFEATTSLVQDVVAAPTPEEKVAKQVEATKATIESCVANLKELSDILSNSQMQTIQSMSDRACAHMDEVQKMIKKAE
ncbi:MAG: phasin family protein [Bdellovibrionales bacterium]